MAFGRFSSTPAPRPMSDINMTPLVDVLLVLVVIFLLTAPLMVSAIRLDLPQAQAAGAATGAPARFVTVVIDAQGQSFVDDQPTTSVALTAMLGRLGAEHPDTEVQLRADHTVPYGRVVEVLDAAQAAGLQRIGFVALPPALPPSLSRALP